ncbi:AI-2E family transporter [Pollutibacter soli]|uniref:AI-2E family transporter n=1 Tax=Pollutibacter soli TaxID=3034157 RepID=UPI0030136DFB
MPSTTPGPLPFLSKMTLSILLLVLIGGIIWVGQEIIVPFAFAILLSVLLLPFNNWMEKKRIPRVAAILISLIISLVFIAGVIYFLATQISNFVDDLPKIKQQLELHFRTLQKWVSQQFNLSRKEQTEMIENATEKMKGSGTGVIGQTFTSITHMLAVVVLLPVYSFLMLYYRDMIRKFLIEVFEDKHEPRVREVLAESRTIVQSYMVGLLIELAIVAAINSAGFLIIGIKYAIFLGILAAILNLIPYIGMLIASILCMLITLTTTNDISDVIWTGVVLVLVQFVDNNILMPRIVSSKVKINALISILGVLIGGGLAGVSGMFLSIPAIAILKVIFDRVDHLKPWGLILGDDITKPQEGKIYKRIRSMSSKQAPKKTSVSAN